MPIRKLPEAPTSAHVIGPAMILVALGVGLGETYLWPRLVIVFGPNVRWMFLCGVFVQAIVMLEMSRYAMATGESIFFGAGRVFKPLMWMFFVVAFCVYIWPGHLSEGSQALQLLIGGNWVVYAVIGMVVIGLIFTVFKFVYTVVESLLSLLVGILVIGSAITAGLVGNLHDLGLTLAGLFRFDQGFPHGTFTAAWFPIIVGSMAFAGPSGMQQMWYTLWLRDKGAGMGTHMPRVRGLLHAGEEETMPDSGSMFDVDDPEEMRKWQGWRNWVYVDTWLLFFGITMLVTIIFTVLAMDASEVNPVAKHNLLGGDQNAALKGMHDAFNQAAGGLGALFYVFIAIVGWKASVGLFDAFARGQADMTYFFFPKAKKFKMSYLYGGWLWGLLIFGIVIIIWGPADGPSQILNTLAFMSTFIMGAYCLTLLAVNNTQLPKKLRPGWFANLFLGIGGVGYLLMLFYSLFAYGAVVG